MGDADDCSMLCAVLPSTGIGALSVREAEGRTNISAGEKVWIFYKYVLFHHLCHVWINLNSMGVVLAFTALNFHL